MTNLDLARSYIFKAEKRLKILKILYDEEDYSDVIRESQEIVELLLKGLLRSAGIEPPKYHDVSRFILEHRDRFPEITQEEIEKICKISRDLRKERELAFYGDIDFIPTEEYTSHDAEQAMESAVYVYNVCSRVIR